MGLWDLILFRSLDWGSIVPVSSCWFIPLRNITQFKSPRTICLLSLPPLPVDLPLLIKCLLTTALLQLPASKCCPPHPFCQHSFLTGKVCLHLIISPLKSFFPYSQIWSSGFLLFDLVLGFYMCIQYAAGFSEFCIVGVSHWVWSLLDQQDELTTKLRGPPVSASPALGSQTGSTAVMCSYVGAADHIRSSLLHGEHRTIPEPGCCSLCFGLLVLSLLFVHCAFKDIES